MSDTTTLVDGLYFGEGPRWHDGRLWFSDFYAHAVKSIDESGQLRTELELDDQPSGLGWLPDGRLLVVAMKERAVKRLDPTGLVLARRYQPSHRALVQRHGGRCTGHRLGR